MLDKLLYIDPGTGSMLFSIIIGIAGVLIFAGHALIIKLKFFFLGGRGKNAEDAAYMADIGLEEIRERDNEPWTWVVEKEY